MDFGYYQWLLSPVAAVYLQGLVPVPNKIQGSIFRFKLKCLDDTLTQIASVTVVVWFVVRNINGYTATTKPLE